MPVLKSLKQHKILLDTHVWLWVMAGNPILTKEFIRAFEQILKNNEVLISPMSIWEIGMLVDKNALKLIWMRWSGLTNL
jgi:PIN domain nuclease of toxin-antitoxin system